MWRLQGHPHGLITSQTGSYTANMAQLWVPGIHSRCVNVNCQAGIGSRNGKGVFGSLSGLSGVAAISTRIRLRQAETAITSRMACIRVSPPTSFRFRGASDASKVAVNTAGPYIAHLRTKSAWAQIRLAAYSQGSRPSAQVPRPATRSY